MALICAGWLAGRGPLAAAPAVPFDAAGAVAPRSVGDSGVGVDGDGVDGHGVDRGGTVGARRRARRAAGGLGVWLRTPQGVAAAVALAVLAAALLAAWSQWQPQRSEETRQQALTLLAAHPLAARREAEAAVREDPLSQPAQETLAEVQRLTGEPRLARATLQKSVREQPSNPRTWLALGRFNLTSRPQAAARELQAAIYLDPESVSTKAIEAGDREAIELHNEYIQALRSSESAGALRSGSGPPAGTAHGGRRAPRPGAEPSGH
jgi:Tfp pilus assembly protein PilF